VVEVWLMRWDSEGPDDTGGMDYEFMDIYKLEGKVVIQIGEDSLNKEWIEIHLTKKEAKELLAELAKVVGGR